MNDWRGEWDSAPQLEARKAEPSCVVPPLRTIREQFAPEHQATAGSQRGLNQRRTNKKPHLHHPVNRRVAGSSPARGASSQKSTQVAKSQRLRVLDLPMPRTFAGLAVA